MRSVFKALGWSTRLGEANWELLGKAESTSWQGGAAWVGEAGVDQRFRSLEDHQGLLGASPGPHGPHGSELHRVNIRAHCDLIHQTGEW
jgi:hypothetical protein